MKLPRFFNSPREKAEPEKEEPSGRNDEFTAIISNMRTVVRKANEKVSGPMDTAVVAGGLAGNNVKIILEKTNDMHAQISSASSAVDEIAANTRNFNGLIQKQDAALSETDSAVSAMSSSVDSVTEVTKRKMETAGKLKEIIEKGGEDVRSTAQAIEEVTVGITAVADVINVINSIAAQTNLLAMNAAIEAAHAGEAGKGFAVVASEVRKLAESTTSNSKTISESLKNIIKQIRVAKDVGESAGESFQNIQREVGDFMEGFSEISRSTSELAEGTRQIVGSMEALKQVSAEISGGSGEIEIGTNSIDSALREVKDFSNMLVDDMDLIKEKIYDISGAQSGIAQYMVEINRNIENFFLKMEEEKTLPKEGDSFNYGLILLMHRNWLIQLRAFLDDRKEDLKASQDDYQKCDLGKWIYGEAKGLEGNPAFRELQEEHKKFHAAAGTIIQTKNAGDKIKAEELYQNIMDNYRSVISLLDRLRFEK